MSAEHDDFVGQVGAGNLRDDVEAHQITGVIFGGYVDFELDRRALLEHANDTVVVLGGHHDLRHDRRRIGSPGRWAAARSAARRLAVFAPLTLRVLWILTACAFAAGSSARQRGGADQNVAAVAAARLEHHTGPFLRQ